MDNFFEEDTIDFMLGQKNGCEYIVLYQMLCLKTINSDGRMANKIGEMIVPYDIDKIVRDTKYFNRNTVIVALELYKSLGLVYEDIDGCLVVSNIDGMIGSESKWAKIKRGQRAVGSKDNVLDNVQQNPIDCNDGQVQDKALDNVHIEIRDKSIDIRDKIKDKEIKEKKTKPIRHKHGEYSHVLLSDDEYEKLANEYPNYAELITFLDEYIEMKGYKAKNHYLVIKKWVVKAVNESHQKSREGGRVF